MTHRRENREPIKCARLSSEQLDGLNRRYAIILKRSFLRRGCQPSTAEDLTQDVFVRLASRLSDQEILNAEAYLMQTASSVWRDHWRKRL
ncbi:sigma factor [Hyphomonas johnsonii]|uniref:RNA polymerase sigma factor n=1 Tax=Hyphomonas johnsonii TaxID=81031 RepID=UPI000A0586F1